MKLDGIIEDLPSKKTPLYKETFEKICNAILDKVYPIGRGFIDFTGTDYSNYLGFIWERELVGLTPIGYNPNDEDFNEIGKTGGSKYLQKHTHNVLSWNGKPVSFNSGAGTNFHISVGNDGNPDQSSMTIGESGTGDSGNLQPYKVVAYWKRVA